MVFFLLLIIAFLPKIGSGPGKSGLNHVMHLMVAFFFFPFCRTQLVWQSEWAYGTFTYRSTPCHV